MTYDDARVGYQTCDSTDSFIVDAPFGGLLLIHIHHIISFCLIRLGLGHLCLLLLLLRQPRDILVISIGLVIGGYLFSIVICICIHMEVSPDLDVWR